MGLKYPDTMTASFFMSIRCLWSVYPRYLRDNVPATGQSFLPHHFFKSAPANDPQRHQKARNNPSKHQAF